MNFRHILFACRESKPLSRLGRTLKNVGHIIDEVSTLHEALIFIKKEHPDIIIVSNAFDREYAADFWEELKKERAANPSDLKVMLITADESPEVKKMVTERGVDDFVAETCTLPLMMERINSLMYDDNSGKELAGSISQSGLIDILQLLEFSAKSGVLTVTSKELKGTMLFAEGRLIEARTDDKQNEAAVYEMLSWEHGEFSFQGKETNRDAPVLASISSLVLEWARVSDEGGKSPTQAPAEFEEKASAPTQDKKESDGPSFEQMLAAELSDSISPSKEADKKEKEDSENPEASADVAETAHNDINHMKESKEEVEEGEESKKGKEVKGEVDEVGEEEEVEDAPAYEPRNWASQLNDWLGYLREKDEEEQ